MTRDHRNHPQPSRRTLLGGAALAALAVATGAGTAAAHDAQITQNPQIRRAPPGRPSSRSPTASSPRESPSADKPYAYMGSRANGAIYRTDLRTGRGRGPLPRAPPARWRSA